MMEDSRKLKRGLKDISPLFSNPQESGQGDILVRSGAPDIQCLSLFSQETPEGLRSLRQYLGTRLGTEDCPCFMVRIDSAVPKTNGKGSEQRWAEIPRTPPGFFQEYGLTWEQCQNFFKKDIASAKAYPSAGGFTVFLDFSYARLDYFEKILPLLDKWILLIEPKLRSLTETYRMIKASLLLNRSLEYFVLIQGPSDSENISVLFEQFSEFVTRRLGVHLNWLGHFQSLENVGPFLQEEAVNQLLLRSYEFSSNFKEKQGLADLISTFSQGHSRVLY